MIRRNKEIGPYLIVLPDGQELFFESEVGSSEAHKEAATKVLHGTGLRIPWGCPDTVSVQLYRLLIKSGQQVRQPLGDLELKPRSLPMTNVQYSEHLNRTLEGLPACVASWISSSAWDRGHSAGGEEMLSIAVDLAHDMRKLLQELRKEWELG